ncbi:hypothetical protein LMG28688_04966 [Paraburkholderia caffeinitolerans]|uniref:Uncharacterized protein n=2 Tax=Paraburkholderia caffeinitolerans TaxID=1723730 RepID=A0A6J5GIS9_9BURK|nr:hypothetical protein LMG28688_04966 [Paraburkholderia caffeinitolerans]
MHELMRRTGSANPNQFAQWFDEATASWTGEEAPSRKPNKRIKQVTATKEQKKWYRIVRGQQALSPKGLKQLSKLFPDAPQYFLEGPDRLWQALWGPVDQLWTICSCVVYDMPYRPDPEVDPGELFTSPELSFEESLYNFECSLLLRRRQFRDEEIELRDLAESIALYRLHNAVNSLGATDGVGAYRCVRMCMDAVELWDQFDAFNTFSSFCVYGAINGELTEMEIRRLKYEPSYRKSVGVSLADIEHYAKWPRDFCSEEDRMETLHICRSASSDSKFKLRDYLDWLDKFASPAIRKRLETYFPQLEEMIRVKDYIR